MELRGGSCWANWITGGLTNGRWKFFKELGALCFARSGKLLKDATAVAACARNDRCATLALGAGWDGAARWWGLLG